LRREQGQAWRDELGRRPRPAIGLSQTAELSMDLLLAVRPFAYFAHPALGVSLLQSAFKSRGFSSRIRYFNLELVELSGVRRYRHITEETAPYSFSERTVLMLRGGAHNYAAPLTRCANRLGYATNTKTRAVGCRIVRTIR
jgi:hypothetical protein